MIAAVTTRGTAGPVTALLQSRGETAADVHPGDDGQGPAILAGLARTPVDTLLLDIGSGVAAADVAGFRVAQPKARVILLAPGRKPGDRLVAQISAAAEIRDVCPDLELLGMVLDHPADFAAALRWRDPSLAPDALTGAAGPTVVERRVAVGTHPVVVTVAGLDRGVGTTTVAAAIAAFLARLGHDTALLELGDRGLRLLSPHPRWLPHLYTFPAQDDAMGILQHRRYPYLVTDAGSMDVTADSLALPPTGAPTDVSLLVLPQARWRFLPLDQLLRRWPPGALPWLLVNGADPDTAEQVRVLIQERSTQRGLAAPVLEMFPAIPTREMPPAGRPVEEALARLLRPVLPDAPAPRRRNLFRR